MLCFDHLKLFTLNIFYVVLYKLYSRRTKPLLNKMFEENEKNEKQIDSTSE